MTLSYAELQARSKALAVAFKDLCGDDAGIAAVWLPRSHQDFLPMLLALSRCNICFALMSTDLKDEELQRQRNQHILKVLTPSFLVVSDQGLPDAAVVVDSTILEIVPEGLRHMDSQGERHLAGKPAPPQAAGALCLLFTGGTFRGRCVVVTHAMVEHEWQNYSECLEVQFPLRIAAHTSVYWGASALGQLSIALAFGGCAVLCEVPDTEDFRRIITDEAVNTIGLVPDQLKLLADDPCVELQDIEAVFIWGEKLPVNVAQRWSHHPKAKLRELLVSTEYWLSFYSAPLEGIGRHKIVKGVEILIVDELGQPVQDGTGELLIHGKMVTAGLVGPETSEATSSFTEIDGKRYFRTRDLVQKWPDGTLEFRGRADMTMKQGGQWVDLVSVESKLQKLHGIEEVAVLSDPGGSSMLHAFLVMRNTNEEELVNVFQEARRILPRGRIHTLCSLPRHHVTRKVDLRKLAELAKGHAESWPLNPESTPSQLIIDRARQKVREHLCWTLLALLTALVWDFKSFIRLKRPSAFAALGLILLPYMHLGFLHAVDADSSLGNCAVALSDNCPMGIWGAMFLSFLSRGTVEWWFDNKRAHVGLSNRYMGFSQLLHLAPNLFVGLWAGFGACQSIRRGRLLAYPLVFWSGIGHRLQYDLERWCTIRYWKWYIFDVVGAAPKWIFHRFFPQAGSRDEVQGDEVQGVQNGDEAAEAAAPAENVEAELAELICSFCSRRMVAAWPPPLIAEKFPLLPPATVNGCNDRNGEPICWSCWVPASAAAEAECRLLAEQLLKDEDSAEKEIHREGKQGVEGESEDQIWTPEEKNQYDRWWWKNKTVDYVELKQSAEELKQSAPGPVLADIKDPQQRKVYKIVQDVLRTEVTDNMSFHGLDSLVLGSLLLRLRAEFGVSLSISQLRNASPQELSQLLEQALELQPQDSQNGTNSGNMDPDREYTVWFSPGQYFPMGGWVLRKDGEICCDKLEEAAWQVISRHNALRAFPADPLRLLSFILDTAVLFTLVSRLLDRNPMTRWIRQCISWALKYSWARVVVRAPEALYGPGGRGGPGLQRPLVQISVTDQQAAEHHLKHRRQILSQTGSPVDIALVQLNARLEGLWVYGANGGMGDFCILASEKDSLGDSTLLMVDRNRKEAARLCGPTDSGWIPPPYGFPALLSGRLHPAEAEDGGGVIWLRLKASNHLAILWRKSASAKPRRYEAFHMPGEELRHRVFNYLVVHAMHIIADGQSYEAIVGDLLSLYSDTKVPPILSNGLAILQTRLFDALDASDPGKHPQLCSLRGSQWRCTKTGYGHILGFRKSVLSSLQLVASRHSVPFDAALLALTAIAVANATGVEQLEFTLYVPLRDGVGEAGLCGLFADWRVLSIEVDKATATVLGVIQQVGHKIRCRQWAVYNALEKPEALMVNFQLLDSAQPSSRAGFTQIGEELWRIGECMKEDVRNNDPLPRIPQPMSFVIEEGDKETWWLLINCCYRDYPPPILRRMLKAFQDAAEAFVNNPTAKAHITFPDNFY